MNQPTSRDAELNRIEAREALDNAVRMSRLGSDANAEAYFASLTPYEIECRAKAQPEKQT